MTATTAGITQREVILSNSLFSRQVFLTLKNKLFSCRFKRHDNTSLIIIILTENGI